VEVSLRVTVLLCKTKVNDVDLVSTLADAHQEVVRLNVAVNERLGVNVLDAGDELIGQEKDGLERELAVAEVEKVLQARAQEIKNHRIVVALGAEPADEGNTDTASEGLVDTGFIFELRVLGLDALELDGNLLSRDDIGTCCQSVFIKPMVRPRVHTQIDVTERPGTDLTADTVLVADTKILPRPVNFCSYDHLDMAQAGHVAHLPAKAVCVCSCRTQYSSQQ